MEAHPTEVIITSTTTDPYLMIHGRDETRRYSITAHPIVDAKGKSGAIVSVWDKGRPVATVERPNVNLYEDVCWVKGTLLSALIDILEADLYKVVDLETADDGFRCGWTRDRRFGVDATYSEDREIWALEVFDTATGRLLGSKTTMRAEIGPDDEAGLRAAMGQFIRQVANDQAF